MIPLVIYIIGFFIYFKYWGIQEIFGKELPLWIGSDYDDNWTKIKGSLFWPAHVTIMVIAFVLYWIVVFLIYVWIKIKQLFTTH